MSIQSKQEELWNALTHGLGAILGIVGLVILIVYETSKTDFSLFSVIVYGLSVIILFTASTLYHAIRNEKLKHKFRVIDHISIYILIAGTYTPVLLITLQDSLGWPLFWTVWGVALFGMILKLFFTGRFELFSTLLYLVMGWLIIFDFSTLNDLMSPQGIYWLATGGAAYTIGIIFYAMSSKPYFHVIWHVFVLVGAMSHFMMVFGYVI
jgi:hemolysin III